MQEIFQNLLGGIINFDIFDQPTGPGERVDQVLAIIQNLIVIALVVLVIAAIVNVILAGLRYITSGGKQEKVDQAGSALKAVFMGLLFFFGGVIGIIMIVGLFSDFGDDQLRETLCRTIEPGPESYIRLCIEN